MTETTAPATGTDGAAAMVPPPRGFAEGDVSNFEAFRREKARKEKAEKALTGADAKERAEFLAWQAEKARQAEEKGAARAEEEAEKANKSLPVRHDGQLYMAERFVYDHSGNLRFVHGLGWYLWTGTHWRADDERADLRAVRHTLKLALRSLADLDDKEERARVYQNVKRTEFSSAMEGVLKIAGSIRPVSVASGMIDADPYLFNTIGGTIDLRDGEIRQCSRDDLITKAAAAAPGDKVSEEWDRFLIRILPDEQVRCYVQRLFGYAMLGKVTEHIMPIFTGTGANGKGTLRDAVMAAFGDYAIEVDPAILMESKHDRHGAFKMRLRGARLVFCSETEKGRRFAEATMKRLVGGDPIEANLMHKNPITFDPSHLLVMMTNHLPAVSGDDPAVWRRITVVPFDVVIPEEERDASLPERLKASPAAVMAWVHQGWLDYQAQGLNAPDVVRARTLKYQQDSDVLARFLTERTMSTGHGFVKARDLFNAWTEWCRENKESAEAIGSEVKFAESLAARGFAKTRAAAGQIYRGLMLLADDDQEEPEDDH